MTTLIQIVTTTGTQEEAKTIARHLVDRRLAACVQIDGPVESCYRWEGDIEAAQEYRCTIKTRAACYGEVESLIRQLHSYDEPEVLATEVHQGSDSYVRWVLEQTTGGGPADT
jgi:periplasmic divalent cation tolerance protein